MEIYEEEVDDLNRDVSGRKRDVVDPANQGTVVGRIKLLENRPAQSPVSPLKEQDKKNGLEQTRQVVVM